jgi:hypothetical protein
MLCSPTFNFGTIIISPIHYLPLEIDSVSRPILYADDTSGLISGNSLQNLQIKSVIVLNALSKWFTMNGLSLNLEKTKIMKFDSNYLQKASLKFFL